MGPGFESLEVHQQKDARSKDFASFLFTSKGLHICFSPVMFDENGNCLDNAIIKANDILEDTLIEKFDMDPMRAHREQETWGKACREPAVYSDLVRFDVKSHLYETNKILLKSNARIEKRE